MVRFFQALPSSREKMYRNWAKSPPMEPRSAVSPDQMAGFQAADSGQSPLNFAGSGRRGRGLDIEAKVSGSCGIVLEKYGEKLKVGTVAESAKL